MHYTHWHRLASASLVIFFALRSMLALNFLFWVHEKLIKMMEASAPWYLDAYIESLYLTRKNIRPIGADKMDFCHGCTPLPSRALLAMTGIWPETSWNLIWKRTMEAWTYPWRPVAVKCVVCRGEQRFSQLGPHQKMPRNNRVFCIPPIFQTSEAEFETPIYGLLVQGAIVVSSPWQTIRRYNKGYKTS